MFVTDKPTIVDFLQAYRDGIRGISDEFADVAEGSIYEVIGGMAAIVWSRQVQHDEDLFRDTLMATASGNALTDRIETIRAVPRNLDRPGTGVAMVSKAGGTSGTFYAGDTIELVDTTGGTETSYFEVATDTVFGTHAAYAAVPIVSKVAGNPKVSALKGDRVIPRFADSVFDNNVVIESLTCEAGTLYEAAPEYVARSEKAIRDRQNGSTTKVIATCRAAGADKVVLFPAAFAGTSNDVGLNVVYVSDKSGVSTPALIAACTLALEESRVLGDNIQVRPIVTAALSVTMVVTLTAASSHFNTEALTQRIRNTLIGSTTTDYSYTLDGWRGAILSAASMVQDVTFITPSADTPVFVTTGGVQRMPDLLNRNTLSASAINVVFAG